MEAVENIVAEHTGVTNAVGSVLAYCFDMKSDMLKGLNLEADAVQVHSTLIDRAIAAAMTGIQNDFHLIPKFVVTDDGKSKANEVAVGAIKVDLCTSYWATVNN